MADYYHKTTVQPEIPVEAMTPLEAWILKQIFQTENDEANRTVYFFAEECIFFDLDTSDPEFVKLLQEDASPFAAKVREKFEAAGSPDCWPLGDLSYVDVFQEIVSRHPEKLPYVYLETAHTCSKMRPGGFGGSAELITASQVHVIDTGQWLDEMISRMRLNPSLSSDDLRPSELNKNIHFQMYALGRAVFRGSCWAVSDV